MTEEEILIRAREASIAAGYTRGLGITHEVATNDEAAIRAGQRDRNWSVLCAAQALRDLSKPLSEIQPPHPDLIEARRLAAEGLAQWYAETPFLRGDKDASPEVQMTLAAIQRGRELERQS